ncbi:MAG: 16S rRNA (guanine(527)-N(7))-methyltransferase RsmG [Clostridiales bacterium]|nr:16S rRNA (guanine(527)-N(7))-methyltransferase RsmG [Clostridiales bacterium]
MIDKELLKKLVLPFGISPTDGEVGMLDRYSDMLFEKNKVMNLTAITEPYDVTVKHFVDSLSVFSVISPKDGESFIDVGTGAGFPGAAVLIMSPHLKMTFLDGTRKKLDFIKESLDLIGLDAEILHMRAEEAGRNACYREKFDYVTARAVANLRELSEYCIPFLKLGGTFVAMKGSDSEDEIKEAEAAISVLGGKISEIKSIEIADGVKRTLVVIKKISQTPPKYPRTSAKIAKQPIK